MKQSHLIGLATPLLLSAGTLATAERFTNMHFGESITFLMPVAPCKNTPHHITVMSTGLKVSGILKPGI